jgi:hypothetical protein
VRPAAFEPGVQAAVNLHQLSVALATISWLMSFASPLDSGQPDSGFGEPLAQRLPTDSDAVEFDELLVRQLGSEVPVALTHERHRVRLQLGAQLPVAGASALARGQPSHALEPVEPT